MKRTIAVLFIMTFLIGFAAPVHAGPKENYNYTYNFWGDAVPSPSPYVLETNINGGDLGIGAFGAPQDLFVSSDNGIYVADTGNNRIVVLDETLQVEQVLSEFDNHGKPDALKGPEGVFVDDKGLIYVADTQNRRLIVLEADGSFVREIGAPESSLLREGFQYTPTKVAVDRAERIFVVSRGSYEGIIEFDSEGSFNGFIGTNRVRFDPLDLLWKRMSTKAQRDQMELFVPLEFNNLDVDRDGFIYTTTSEENSFQPIKKLNPSGADILRSEGYFPPMGDINTRKVGSTPGSSIFIDIASDEGGMYNALDSKRGRIFTYDKDGNLLYMFGGLGSQHDNFRTPSAIDMLGDRVVILDKDRARISLFEPTRYGSMIREAVISLYNGKSEEASAAWSQVLQLNANFEVGYIGIGKSLLKKGENREAMTYFKLGNERALYSEAFKRYRKELVLERFGYIVTSIAAAVGFIFLAIKLGRRKMAGQHYEEVGVLKNPFYTMMHPFNGFWEMKYENKGRLKVAFFILLSLVIVTIIKRQYSGFVVNFNNLAALNSIDELKYIVLPFVLWCVANWSLTTLMDGEGKFKDIVMATGYALMPMVVINIPQVLYSRIITGEESSFYYLLDAIALFWSIGLLFVGTMTVHQYSAGKTVVTMALTLVVIGILVFLGVLFFSMMQQMISFVVSIYKELAFRV
ncbi:YIP1 family protein [Paenibacillus sp. LHD-117]|uniref:YIP1 family protein n=1 Tax=Paenibacillus sp. LHD-117 TaxID=3071412 RepID=UPI0027E09051|nr:YIP1 family protein [Paenibacillus sp. LHD-117]MDQ6420013.1 YIP1 family protein [Paenibacillus sp. LHD-117]